MGKKKGASASEAAKVSRDWSASAISNRDINKLRALGFISASEDDIRLPVKKDESRVSSAELSAEELRDDVRRLTCLSMRDNIVLTSARSSYDSDHPPTEALAAARCYPPTPESGVVLEDDDEDSDGTEEAPHALEDSDVQEEEATEDDAYIRSRRRKQVHDEFITTAESSPSGGDNDADEAAAPPPVMKSSTSFFAGEDDLDLSDDNDDEVPLAKRAKLFSERAASAKESNPSPAKLTPPSRTVVEKVPVSTVIPPGDVPTSSAGRDHVLEANRLVTDAKNENVLLKEEVKKLKQRLKDELDAKHAAAAAIDKKEGALRESIRDLLDAADLTVTRRYQLREDSTADALSLATESNVQVLSLLKKAKGALSRLYSMIFPKMKEDKTLDEMAASFLVDPSEPVEGSTVPPTMEPNMSRGDKDEDEYEEEDWVVSLRDKGKSVFKVICKDKIASTHFFEILTTAIESQKLIWMHENTIDKKGALEREYANDVASLKNDLEEEQETIASLEEQLETLEVSQNEIVSKLTKERDHAKAQVKMLKKENPKVGVGHDKLVKDLDDLDKAHKVLESEHSILTKSHEQLQASYLKEHAMLPSLLNMSCDDACATNSTSCEASILKENVELRAQLELLTSNYGKLEENHGKLSSSHEDLLASHDRLKLAHEAIISKATPCSTSSSTCVVTNHVEEIKELKAQVTSLKTDLVKSHEGKCKLDKMLSVQQSPNDKSGLGFNSNNKNKSKNNKIKKGQLQVKDPAKIVCFKCKIEGHHVRSCPLKKKQKGKRPQAQTHIQPQVEEMPLPKKNQANAPIVEKSSEKKEKKRTCYICREKGHISSFCTIGTSSNSITIDDVYSLRKDEGGNVFAKYVGAQSGVKKRTIWVAKPIVTNLLGPNLVGDQQSKI
ncbi:hypothetical protein QYE76_071752 [Lolium multiflorum]|uniref:CCHC-type domain-containing protein n=1 Tax=Lolium multiflorum TaxID=4521 RepID=A0AAD8SKM4_LOLMU|nr:hypothetical protein QYE76_071752 [Lolium multiflorum]